MSRRWIQRAIKHPGSLKRWAKQHHCLNKDGTINLRKAERIAKREGNTHRLRQIALAKRLRRWSRRKKKSRRW